MAYNKNLEVVMKQLIEQIKPIKGYEGRYSISNYGYVISLSRNIYQGKMLHRTTFEKVLKFSSAGDYLSVTLFKNNKRMFETMHGLVWDHFGDHPRNGMVLQIDHIDSNPKNNRINNLQLLTSRQNTSKYYSEHSHSSKYVGVIWQKEMNKWRARIYINGNLKHLGCFDKEDDAHLAYQKALSSLIR
jgi:hypothetical protein